MIIRLGYVLAVIFIWGCANTTVNDSGANISLINPNGDSELALLMREMFEDGMRVKQQVLDGKTPKITCDYVRIHSATATQPEKVATPNFAAHAQAYEASANALLVAEGPERGNAYQSMVGACMSCHQSMCPGPMVKIKKMYLSEEEILRLNEN